MAMLYLKIVIRKKKSFLSQSMMSQIFHNKEVEARVEILLYILAVIKMEMMYQIA